MIRGPSCHDCGNSTDAMNDRFTCARCGWTYDPITTELRAATDADATQLTTISDAIDDYWERLTEAYRATLVALHDGEIPPTGPSEVESPLAPRFEQAIRCFHTYKYRRLIRRALWGDDTVTRETRPSPAATAHAYPSIFVVHDRPTVEIAYEFSDVNYDAANGTLVLPLLDDQGIRVTAAESEALPSTDEASAFSVRCFLSSDRPTFTFVSRPPEPDGDRLPTHEFLDEEDIDAVTRELATLDVGDTHELIATLESLAQAPEPGVAPFGSQGFLTLVAFIVEARPAIWDAPSGRNEYTDAYEALIDEIARITGSTARIDEDGMYKLAHDGTRYDYLGDEFDHREIGEFLGYPDEAIAAFKTNLNIDWPGQFEDMNFNTYEFVGWHVLDGNGSARLGQAMEFVPYVCPSPSLDLLQETVERGQRRVQAFARVDAALDDPILRPYVVDRLKASWSPVFGGVYPLSAPLPDDSDETES